MKVMRKNLFLSVFALIATVCFAMTLIFASNTVKTAKADAPALAKTNFALSTDDEHQYMLIATPITGEFNPSLVYEVGYEFDGDQPTVEQADVKKYYTTINGDSAKAIWGDPYTDETPMIVWEIVNDASKVYNATAYFKVGEIDENDGKLYPTEPETKVTGAARNLKVYTLTFDVDGGTPISPIKVDHGASLATVLEGVSGVLSDGYSVEWHLKTDENIYEEITTQTVTSNTVVRCAAVNLYQAHAEAGCAGLTGTRLIANAATTKFTYTSPIYLNEGDNVIAKFMTTDEIRSSDSLLKSYEVEYVQITLTDTNTKASIGIRIVAAEYNPNAAVAIFLNKNYVTMLSDGNYSNFSNVTMGHDSEYKAIPEIRYNTTSGDITYCGQTVYNSAGFGTTNPLTVTVEVNVNVANCGIVLNTLCNEKLATAAIVTFDVSGGSAVSPISGDCGTSLATLIENVSVTTPPVGYNFVKWQLKTGEGTYSDLAGNETLTDDIVLKAVYALKTYTVTFEMGDGTSISPMTVDYGTSVSALNAIDVTAPSHYHFDKWQLKTGEDTYVDFVGNETLTENITVKAVYAIDTHSVSFEMGDGTAISPINVDYGTSLGTVLSGVSATPPTGYHFDKWQLKTGESTYEDVDAQTITGDTVVKALYEITTYTITINRVNGSTEYLTFTVEDRATKLASISLTPNDADWIYSWETSLPAELTLENHTFAETRVAKFSVSSGTGSVASNTYQAHAETGYAGVTGTRLIANATTTKFTYASASPIYLNTGDNVIAKFMTTNTVNASGLNNLDINYVSYTLTDTVTGKTLTIRVDSMPFHDKGNIPNAYIAIFIDGVFKDVISDGYFSNYANVTMNSDWAYKYIPEIRLNTLKGSISYCNRTDIYENGADLYEFGVTNPLSVSVELSVRETGYGIVLNTLCNEKLATIATVEKSESDLYTITGADTVNKGETYTFTVAVSSGYVDACTVLVNGEVVTATAGVYSVSNVQDDLYITVKGIFALTSGHGSVAGNVSQAHAEAGCDGITGTELISTDVGAATFTYGSTVKLNTGDNVIAKFMTTDEIRSSDSVLKSYEVEYVQITMTDTVTGGSLGIRIVEENSNPNAAVAIFLSGSYVTMVADGYYSNFSNVTMGSDWAYKAIPEIRYNTTSGDITYCGKTVYNLAGFGTTNPLTVTVEVNVNVADYGIVIDTLCNQSL